MPTQGFKSDKGYLEQETYTDYTDYTDYNIVIALHPQT